jgi:hypothetical protein
MFHVPPRLRLHCVISQKMELARNVLSGYRFNAKNGGSLSAPLTLWTRVPFERLTASKLFKTLFPATRLQHSTVDPTRRD